jgi:hypothetical protein
MSLCPHGARLSSFTPRCQGPVSSGIAALRLLCLIPALVLVCAQSTAAFSYVNGPIVTKANDVVEEVPASIYLGASLRLTVKNTASAKKYRNSPFQVRMFRVPYGDFIPRSWAYIDSCYVYLSSVFSFRGSNDETVNLGRFADDAFLDITAGSINSGTYLLIFEQGADREKIFRLHENNRDAYFKKGLFLEIKPLRHYSETETLKIASKASNRTMALYSEINDNTPKLKCFKYKSVVGGDGETEVATLEICEPKSGGDTRVLPQRPDISLTP